MAGRVAYYGNIVRDGLVLDLDAAKRDSYPGSGTVWRDIAGGVITGTLVNGPTFNSNFGGGISVNGINNQINTTFQFSGTGNATIYIWCNISSSSTRDMILLQGNSTGRVWLYKNSTNTLGLNTYWGGSFDYYLDTSTIISNQNGLITAVLDKTGNQSLYYNGVFIGSINISLASLVPYQNSQLQLSSLSSPPNWYRPVGTFYNIMCYNTAHTNNQILQNYNALKGRYGL
jgi:hypothetical protein